MATGGYDGNEEMLKKYAGSRYTMGEVMQNVGDGIEMAWDAGADENTPVDYAEYLDQLLEINLEEISWRSTGILLEY